jgi:hypothetical protein
VRGTILLVLASPEYLRFFDTTILLLIERGHRVHLVVGDAGGHKPVGLEGAGALPLSGVSVVPASRTFWADTAYAFRATVDFLRFLHPDFENAPVLRQRIKRKVLPVAWQWLDRIRVLPVDVLNGLLAALAVCERAIPIDPRVISVLRGLQPDLVIVSPLVDAASAQVDWIKGARRLGIPSAVAVASWDNLTNKGLMRSQPDRVFVWNDIQREEAERYHAVAQERCVATGAPVFDRWFHAKPSRSREEFCAAMGLPDARPYALFTGSSSFIADAPAEVAFGRRWIQSLRSSGRTEIQDLAVVVRPHPYNHDAWETVDLSAFGAAAVWPRGCYNASDDRGRSDFFESLYHAAAVVGINTSAMIEAAIVGRPVLTITGFTATQTGTLHFRHLLTSNGGPVLSASSFDEHLRQLGEILADSAAWRSVAERFVASFVRAHDRDTDAALRLAAAIEQTARLQVEPKNVGAASLLTPAMCAFGMWTAAVQRLSGPDPWTPVRKTVMHPLKDGRKRAVRALTRRRERIVRSARVAVNGMRRSEHAVRAQIRNAPIVWKRCRRAVRQARYTVGVFIRGGAAAPPARKP